MSTPVSSLFFKSLLAATLTLTVFAAVPATAQTRVTESFAAPVGGVPADWRVAVRKVAEPGKVVEIEPLSSADPTPALLIQREGRLPESGALFYTGSDGSIRNGALADFTASVTFRFNETKPGPNLRGFILRAKRPAFERSEGYFVAVAPYGSGRTLMISYNPQNHVDSGTVLASVALPENLKPGSDYVLNVRASGASIEATLTAAGAAADSAPIATVRTDEATQSASGLFGLRGAYSNAGPIKTWFRQLHFTDAAR